MGSAWEDVITAIDRMTPQAVYAAQYLVPSSHRDRDADRPAWVPAHMLDDWRQLLEDTTLAAERQRGISSAIIGVVERTYGTASAAQAPRRGCPSGSLSAGATARACGNNAIEGWRILAEADIDGDIMRSLED